MFIDENLKDRLLKHFGVEFDDECNTERLNDIIELAQALKEEKDIITLGLDACKHQDLHVEVIRTLVSYEYYMRICEHGKPCTTYGKTVKFPDVNGLLKGVADYLDDELDAR